MKKNKFHKALSILLVIACVAAIFEFGVYCGGRYKKLDIIMELIEHYFVLDYDKDEVLDIAAKFMVMALEDPYSEYMSREEAEIFEENLTGIYTGIGVAIFIDSEENHIIVKEVEKDSPAENAGIKKGDIISEVDGIKADNESFDRIYYYIKGVSDEAPDDDVEMTVKVLRDGEELEFKVKRSVLNYENAASEMNEGILYVRLAEFSEASAEKFSGIMEENKDAKGIILDLRDNGGGNLESLVEIAQWLINKGVLLTVEDARGEKTEFTLDGKNYTDVPLVVLVNGYTASASEVFAAAIKETGRGYVIGETTFGKGLVQSVFPLGDGSLLKLTTERYYTAGGNYIHEIGVTPDLIIEDEEKQIDAAKEYLKDKIS